MKNFLAVSAMLAVTGCASISGETTQPISLQTTQDNKEVYGVGCTLINDEGKWFLKSPGSVKVHKSTGDLVIDCNNNGNIVGHETLVSKSNGAVWGNILAGGGVGYLVDRNTGAGFNYPNNITVALHKIGDSVSQPNSGLPSSPEASSTIKAPDFQIAQDFRKVQLDATKSQNIEFLFYFPTQDAANRVANALNLHGFATKIQPSEKTNNFSLAAQKSITPTETTLSGLRLLFIDMANAEHGQYDSWQLAATQ